MNVDDIFKRYKWIILLCVLGIGIIVGKTSTPTRIITKTEYVEKVVEKEVKVDYQKQKEKTITKPDGTVIKVVEQVKLKKEEKEKIKEKEVVKLEYKELIKPNKEVYLMFDPFTMKPQVFGVGYRVIDDVWVKAEKNKSDYLIGVGLQF